MAKRIINGRVVKIREGSVVTINVMMKKFHKKYRKQITLIRKFHAKCFKKVALGDMVSLQESRPYAKTIHWVVI